MTRKLIKFLIVAGLLVAGLVYFAQRNALSKEDSGLTSDIDTLQGNIGQQLSVMSSRAQEIGLQAKNVLGTSIQVDESQPSIQEKAINYGQYVYCKQVVEGFEANQSSK
ncbi:MAG TPA: hypothetical protein VGA89_00820 [Patescibacteria group bacterium]|jgi:hypothetical protein